ncbi:glycine zipper 2TM domain-containing protein [Erythrobacter litoralis]|uniref:17 kDa surface antigen n=1 Tax=Erythrobacter litoralis (strain HTCC2594) TaxID=314225 RepID=Q2N9I6_ERYLH|nr:glycine zipper 2TM domain-containing protein [Erythrobacter litoralis]ABC63655.1 hypothetical protein ELI_07815 [Erythrobacter litoralis HTCC2594]
MKKFAIAFAAASVTLPMAVPAQADPPRHAKAYGKRAKDAQIYDSRGYYREPRRITRSSQVWRGDDGRYYCKRDNGTTGLIIGAGVGALAGRELAGRGDRTLGTILGGVVGGVLGREIDKGSLRCR